MIYYYFGSKEGLYLKVLRRGLRPHPQHRNRTSPRRSAPEDALRKLVAFTFDYQHENDDFIRLVMNENMHRGEFLAQSKTIQQRNLRRSTRSSWFTTGA